jgi:hydroxypyruvate reductase 1
MQRENEWKVHNPSGNKRVVVTKELPGEGWLEILAESDCRVEYCTSTEILGVDEIKKAIGDSCDAAIGQLTEAWGQELFQALKNAGCTAYSNYAVGYNNVDVAAATKLGIPVGNTPGVLTEATAEMAVALTFAAARRVVEADKFMRSGQFKGWLPSLFLGHLLEGKTVGIIGAGRIGAAYARMMVEGHKMNLIYYDLYPNKALEDYVSGYNEFLKSQGKNPVSCRQAESIEELLQESDIVSLNTVLNKDTHHLMDKKNLELMKKKSILVNASRGPLIDEEALVEHCKNNPEFSAALDVFEDEPAMKPGLAELENVVIVPHIASATFWTRTGMAVLAAYNVARILDGYPVWQDSDVLPFLDDNPPKAAPSILNAKDLGIPVYGS